MIRLQNNTPYIYCQESRDFQLFCRLYDAVNNGVKFDIDSIININDPDLISDRIINLLCTKVGFFPKHNYNTNLLRGIIKIFPEIMKYKGSSRGIELAILTILKYEDTKGVYEIFIDNDNGEINIYTSIDLQNKLALDDILSYIIPIGYIYKLGKYTPYNAITKLNTLTSINNLWTAPTSNISQVIGNDRVLKSSTSKVDSFNFNYEIQQKVTGTISNSNIIGKDNNNELNEYIVNPNVNNGKRDKVDLPSNFELKITKESELNQGVNNARRSTRKK